MSYTISELREQNHNSIADVYEIFINFFGERFVDIQNLDSRPYILVWWPNVTVTNENDRSIQIQDLYAKVTLTEEGRIPYESRGFQLCRTTFSEIQYNSGYLHSHIPHFSGVPSFQNPCLGRGPINNTIMDLKNGYEETLWMLFCQELALYVTVESLTGGPYIRMETVGAGRALYGYVDYKNLDNYNSLNTVKQYYRLNSDEEKETFKRNLIDFTKYYLQHGHLNLNFLNGKYVAGMPYYDFMVDISNSFIEYFNRYGHREHIQRLYEKEIIIKAIAANNKFYSSQNQNNNDYSRVEGSSILTFKGEVKRLHIEREADVPVEEVILLYNDIALFILCNILKIINYRYKNGYNRTESNSDTNGSTEGTTASSYKTAYYL